MPVCASDLWFLQSLKEYTCWNLGQVFCLSAFDILLQNILQTVILNLSCKVTLNC